MVKKKRKRPKTLKSLSRKNKKEKDPLFTSRMKRWIVSVLMILLGIIIVFSFFEKAGSFGVLVYKIFDYLIGKTVYFIPFLLFLGGFLMMRPKRKRITATILVGFFLCLFGISGILASKNIDLNQGGLLGNLLSWPLLKYSSLVITMIVFSALILIGLLIFYETIPKKGKKEKIEKEIEDEAKEDVKEEKEVEKKRPKFEVKPVEIVRKKAEAIVVKKDKEKKKEEISVLDEEYKMPPLDLLDTKEEVPSSGNVEYNTEAIQRTLQNFGISVEMAEVNIGPTVTQYTLKPAEGVKLSRLTSLNNDLALSLAAHPIRIEAPIPGKSLVGIEVPNKSRVSVKMGSLISDSVFQGSVPLTLALGRDVMGFPLCADLARMPHMLVAGATGSGKTICLNSLILSLIFRNSPKLLRLILIDPKRVEFPIYSTLPHLLTPVILNARKAVNALNWLIGEMERRFDVLKEFGARDILTYNSSLKKKPKEDFEIMPYIVLVVDELADLMMSRGKEVEASIVRLSQLSRAVGIHLVLATQRPSVEVITGLIKANITTRIAFQVASQIDSRTILDTAGAEKLLGRGDMLFISSEFSRPKRIQGGFVSSIELKKVVDFISKENVPEERKDIEEESADEKAGLMPTHSSTGEEIANFSARDELYEEAKELVIQFQKASASLLQRRLQIGYARAARILDMLEEDNIVGPQDGAKPRAVYSGKDSADEDGFIDAAKVEVE